MRQGGTKKSKGHHHSHRGDLLCHVDGLMHTRRRTVSFFWLTGEEKLRRGPRLKSGERIPPHPPPAPHPRVISIRQQTKLSCQHTLLSGDISRDSGSLGEEGPTLSVTRPRTDNINNREAGKCLKTGANREKKVDVQ